MALNTGGGQPGHSRRDRQGQRAECQGQRCHLPCRRPAGCVSAHGQRHLGEHVWSPGQSRRLVGNRPSKRRHAGSQRQPDSRRHHRSSRRHHDPRQGWLPAPAWGREPSRARVASLEVRFSKMRTVRALQPSASSKTSIAPNQAHAQTDQSSGLADHLPSFHAHP